MQGVYAFNARSAIQTRIKLFEMDDAVIQNNVADADAIHPKTILTEFFELCDNALISSKSAAKVKLTASKFGGRFYVFSCQPIDMDGNEANIKQAKGMLLPFENVYELQTFLETNCGDGKNVKDWLEIHTLEIEFVPVECFADANNALPLPTLTTNQGLAYTSTSTLSGELCICSSDENGHLEKVLWPLIHSQPFPLCQMFFSNFSMPA